MPRKYLGFVALCCALLIPGATGPAGDPIMIEACLTANAIAQLELHPTRTSPLDLEVSGDVPGLGPGTSGYLTREELLALPQVSYLVSDDPNFSGPTRISGVPLEELAKNLSAAPQTDLIIALSADKYTGNYPPAYVSAHQPILVLKIEGKDPSEWPKDSEGLSQNMGPYLISHAEFTPSFKILAHEDESQIPWSVIRIEFRNETEVFGAIAPRGPNAQNAAVQAGYRIAEQNCFRCHNMGNEGGQKAQRSWLVLSRWANASPDYFAAYIRDPKAKNPRAKMPGFPGYDQATTQALTAYFRASVSGAKQ
jgi:mono/diheme cytochrome c family protein